MLKRVNTTILSLLLILMVSCSKSPSEPEDEVPVYKGPANEPPVAYFEVNPQGGDLRTLFDFDASGSHDPDDPPDYLRVYWDWEGDGRWDTSPSYQKTRNHLFERPGLHNVVMRVIDPSGARDTTSHEVYVESTLRWTFEIGQVQLYGSHSSLALGDDGTVFALRADGQLFAIDSNGTLIWQTATSYNYHGTPVIGDDGTIYIGTEEYLHAIAYTGEHLWEIVVEGGVSASPAVSSDGTLYVGTGQGKLLSISPGGIIQWDVALGEPFFSYRNKCAPVVGYGGIIYVWTEDGGLLSLNPDGSERWKLEPKVGEFFSHPAVSDDGTVYLGADGDMFNDHLVAIDDTGSIKWICPVHMYREITMGVGTASSPVIGPDGTVYVAAGDKFIHAIGSSGSELWSRWEEGVVVSCPAIGSDGTIYACSQFGGVYAINPDGTLQWQFQADHSFFGSPVVGNESLYCLDDNGCLYAFECSSQALASGEWPSNRGNARNTARK